MTTKILHRRTLRTRSFAGCALFLSLVVVALPVWAAVGLVYFNAQAGSVPSEVIVSWATESETNVVGFRVKRSTLPLVQTATVVATVPSTGSATTGAEYQIVDHGLTPGQPYYYWLVEIDSSATEILLTQGVRVVPGTLAGRHIYLPVIQAIR